MGWDLERERVVASQFTDAAVQGKAEYRYLWLPRGGERCGSRQRPLVVEMWVRWKVWVEEVFPTGEGLSV